jgi:glycosyltransferase involved in cell wall biosynthesis
MKIVLLSSYAYSLINFRGALLAAMAGAGHEVVACAPEDDPEIRHKLAAMGVRYERVPMQRTDRNPFGDLLTLFGLTRLLRAERPDIVLAYTQKPIIYGGIAAQIAGRIRYYAMVSGLGYVFTDDGRRQRRLLKLVVSILYRLGIRRAKSVFIFNSDDRDEMIRHRILRPDQTAIQVPGSGVDIRRFAAQPVPPGPPTFLMIARLLRDKGLLEFIDAARRVRSRHPETRFQLLGPLDPNPAGIRREQLEAWQSKGVIEYLGETRDVVPHLARSSVFVLPSYYREGLPRTILEAMASGRAVITTDSTGCREPITPGENGLLVPVRDAGALAEAMMRFVREPELAQRMGRRAREIAEERFDVAKVNALLMSSMGLATAVQPPVFVPQPATTRPAIGRV